MNVTNQQPVSASAFPGGFARQPEFLERTAARATKLVAASARKSFDPGRDIDWSIPVDDSAFHLPPEYLSLYGTAQWATMSEALRITYSRHETAALSGTGIWLENVLMRVVVDLLYEMPAQHPLHRYLLIEVADECRHSAMFAEYMRRANTPDYRPPPGTRRLGHLVRSAYRGASAFLAILAAEELLDAVNRKTMADPNLHAVSRAIARIHVVEEARHVSLARTYLEEVYPRLSRGQRLATALVAPFTVRVIASATVNRQVFDELGIAGGYRAALDNPWRRERIIEDLGKLTAFLTDLKVIDSWNRPIWRKFGLLA